MPHNPELFDQRMGFASLFNMDLRYIMAERHFPNATLEVDMRENTDFDMDFGMYVSEDCTNIRYATRIRSRWYYDHNKREFTIRESHESGARTEVHKIMCDPRTTYYQYGFASINEYHYLEHQKNPLKYADELENRHLEYWFVGRMDVLRDFLEKQYFEHPDLNDKYWTMRRHRVEGNGDTFLVFTQDEVPGFVVDSSEHDGWYFDENKRLWTRQKPFIVRPNVNMNDVV